MNRPGIPGDPKPSEGQAINAAVEYSAEVREAAVGMALTAPGQLPVPSERTLSRSRSVSSDARRGAVGRQGPCRPARRCLRDADRVQRQFRANRPDALWVTAIAYAATWAAVDSVRNYCDNALQRWSVIAARGRIRRPWRSPRGSGWTGRTTSGQAPTGYRPAADVEAGYCEQLTESARPA